MQRRDFERVSRVDRPVYRVATTEIEKKRVEPLIQSRQLQKSRKNYRLLSISLGVIILLMLVSGSWMIVSNRSSHQQTTVVIPQSVLDSVEFPLYVPSNLLKGFRVSSSPQIQGDVVSFNYTYEGDKQLIMTQQTRPKLMEEVRKTKEFDTTLGKSYIADLGGRTAGFIVTDKTLIIITGSTGKIDGVQLESFMRSLRKAD